MNSRTHQYAFLLVEDNLGDYLLTEEYLQETPIRPTLYHVQSYREACQWLTHSQHPLDAIFLDLSLPDKEGQELITGILNMAGAVPVIILTGNSNEELAVAALSLGVADYLLKDDLTPALLHKSILYNIERYKNIMRVKESEQRYLDLFQLSPQPMLVYDTVTFRFINVNNAAIQHYGYALEEFRKMTVQDLLIPSLQPTAMTAAAYISIAHPPQNFEGLVKHQKKNGETIVVNITKSKVLYEGKECELAIANDVTENLQRAQAIEQQNQKLKEIAWIQSHIVRAPLARILGLSNMIGDPQISHADKLKCMELLTRSTRELDTYIREIVSRAQLIEEEE